jgi:hypothetical protein
MHKVVSLPSCTVVKSIVFILTLILFFSGTAIFPYRVCVGDRNVPIAMQKDTVKKDIPQEKAHKNGKQLVGYYYNKLLLENKMGLPHLENGFDSLCIRIWYGYSTKVDTIQIVTLKYSYRKWSAQFSLASFRLNNNADSVLSITQHTQVGSPESGGKKFANQLVELRISTLPDMRDIPGYTDMTGGGNSVTLEIATKRLYRIYSYTSPSIAQGTIWQAKNIERLMSLVRREFHFKQLRVI